MESSRRFPGSHDANCIFPKSPNDYQNYEAIGVADCRPSLFLSNDRKIQVNRVIGHDLFSFGWGYPVNGNVIQVGGIPVE